MSSQAITGFAIRSGKSGGIGVALGINVFLPAAAILVAIFYPRVRTAWLGTILLSALFVLGSMLCQDLRFWLWHITELRRLTHPILVVGCVAGGVIGTISALVASRVRVVGVAPDPARCATCGYRRDALVVCPECGSGRP